MRRKLAALPFAALLFISGCANMEQNLKDTDALLLSEREVRDIIQGNTVTSTTGESFYFDVSGSVKGKGSYGGVMRGKWNITEDGNLCVFDWNSLNAPSGCYRVYFDNSSKRRKFVDMNGEPRWTLLNVITGNPNNY